MEAGDEHRRVLHSQRAQDVGPGAPIRGRRQRDARDAGKAIGEARERAVLRTELMAPLRHAMRLVDREQRERDAREPVERAVAEQAFGRDIQQVERALRQITRDLARLVRIKLRVQRAGGDADLTKCRDLIVHQRDQRRDDDRGARPAQRRHLVAQALAAPGRHQHQRIPARHDMTHHGFLGAAKGGEAEHAAEDVRRIGARDVVHAGANRRGRNEVPRIASRRQPTSCATVSWLAD